MVLADRESLLGRCPLQQDQGEGLTGGPTHLANTGHPSASTGFAKKGKKEFPGRKSRTLLAPWPKTCPSSYLLLRRALKSWAPGQLAVPDKLPQQ